MKPDAKRKRGFYWVRFEGAITIAEYVASVRGTYSDWKFGGCSVDGDHWHTCGSTACIQDSEICEMLGPVVPYRQRRRAA